MTDFTPEEKQAMRDRIVQDLDRIMTELVDHKPKGWMSLLHRIADQKAQLCGLCEASPNYEKPDKIIIQVVSGEEAELPPA